MYITVPTGQRKPTPRPVRGAAYEPHPRGENQRRVANRRVAPAADTAEHVRLASVMAKLALSRDYFGHCRCCAGI